ncbi:MAG: PD40 domain-containing protein [Chitinophagaceae bacterium]|nr:PD40 domain-containing protein [Anaerolineae bacterium]
MFRVLSSRPFFLLMLTVGIISGCAVLLAQGIGLLIGGNVIAFETQRDGNAEIYLVDVNTHALHNVTHHPAADTNPAWSPDGKRLAFVSHRNAGGERRIYVAEVSDREAAYAITPHDGLLGAVPGAMKWSADGERVLFLRAAGGRRSIMSVAATGDEPPRALSEDDVEAQLYLQELSQQWSGIAFAPELVETERPSVTVEFIKNQWWIVIHYSPEQSQRQQIATMSNDAVSMDSLPHWSPDGEQLVYADLVGLEMELFTVNAVAGAAPNRLTYGGGIAPAWRP